MTQDYQLAAHWYSAPAEQGYALAQYNLGWLYAKGQGVAPTWAARCTGSARPPSRASRRPEQSRA